MDVPSINGRNEDADGLLPKNVSERYRDQLQAMLCAWCQEKVASWGPTLFVSLNFKAVIPRDMGGSLNLDAAIARLEVKRFGSRLDRLVYGHRVQRFNRRLRRIPFLEYGHDRGWHCHMLIERPEGIEDVRFLHFIKKAWSKSPWSTGLHERMADEGAAGYLTKARSKSEMESWTDTIILEAVVTDTK